MPPSRVPVGIAGTGSCIPQTVISNAELSALINIPGKGADWASAKLGIDARRFMTRLNLAGQPSEEADELDMAERAARLALERGNLGPGEVDALWYVSCTQLPPFRQHFSKSAFELHRRLGLRADALVLEMDAGCGGATHAMVLGTKLIAGSEMDSLLVVPSNGPSRYYRSWEHYIAADVWLSMYIFGDGAGASLCPATCMADGCDYTTEMEADQTEGYCEVTAADPSRAGRIRDLNDRFRRTFQGGTVVVTVGIAALPEMVRAHALKAVADFNQFDGTNDPHKEHDFGAFDLRGRTFFWKIDYYDKDLQGGSENPADPEVTTRVLTVMLSEEY